MVVEEAGAVAVAGVVAVAVGGEDLAVAEEVVEDSVIVVDEAVDVAEVVEGSLIAEEVMDVVVVRQEGKSSFSRGHNLTKSNMSIIVEREPEGFSKARDLK